MNPDACDRVRSAIDAAAQTDVDRIKLESLSGLRGGGHWSAVGDQPAQPFRIACICMNEVRAGSVASQVAEPQERKPIESLRTSLTDLSRPLSKDVETARRQSDVSDGLSGEVSPRMNLAKREEDASDMLPLAPGRACATVWS